MATSSARVQGVTLKVEDGQQRLTALAGALLAVTNRGNDFVVEVETGDVVAPRNRPPPQWVPLLHANPGVDIAKVSVLSKRLRDDPLNASILEADEQAFVEDVFKRLNTAGKRLTATEVFRASHANHATGKRSVEQFRLETTSSLVRSMSRTC